MSFVIVSNFDEIVGDQFEDRGEAILAAERMWAEAHNKRIVGKTFEVRDAAIAAEQRQHERVAADVARLTGEAPSEANGWLLAGRECFCDEGARCANHDTAAEADAFWGSVADRNHRSAHRVAEVTEQERADCVYEGREHRYADVA